MARLRAGDRDAQTEVFDRYAHDVIRAVSRRLRRRPAVTVGADAVAQSVLLSFFARHVADEVDLRDEGSLWALLLEIAIRHCERWNKRFRAAKRDARPAPVGAGGVDPEDDEPAPEEA